MVRLCISVSLLVAFSVQAQSSLGIQSVNAETGGLFGGVLAGVGDVNGDGVTDLLVGASGEIWQGQPASGRAYLVDGKTGYTIAGLHAPASTETPPGSSGTRFGAAVAGLGDISGDGIPDLGVGLPDDNQGGSVVLFSGADGTLIRRIVAPTPGAFGHALASLGDVTGDGVPDVLVGAYKTSFSQGQAYVFGGSDGELVYTLTATTLQTGADFGRAVAGGMDVTGDGVPDGLVAARNEGVGGRVYIFNGATGQAGRYLVSPNPSPGGQFGLAIGFCEDMTGDGLAEIVVGAGREADAITDAGRAYIFDGATGDVLHSLKSPNPAERGWFGQNVTCLNDIDQDAIPDVAVGAPGETAGDYRSGTVYVFSGATGDAVAQLRSPQPVDGGRFGIWLATVSGPDAGSALRIAVGADTEPASETLGAGRVHLMPIALAPVGTRSEADASEFEVSLSYPNPGRDQFSMDLSLPKAAHVQVLVTDALGRRVMERPAETLSSGTHTLELDARHLSAGTYTAFVLAEGYPPRVRRMVVIR